MKLGIALGITLFISFDKVPATPLDYEPIEEKMIAIQQSLESLECDNNTNEEVITVTIENNQCKIIANYDQNFKLLSTSKKDNSIHWIGALVDSVLIGFFSYGFASIILTIAIFIIEGLLEWIGNLFKASKSKI